MQGIRSPISAVSDVKIEAAIVMNPHEIQHVGEVKQTVPIARRWVVFGEWQNIVDRYHAYKEQKQPNCEKRCDDIRAKLKERR